MSRSVMRIASTPARLMATAVALAALSSCSVPAREDEHPQGDPADPPTAASPASTGPGGAARPTSLSSRRVLQVRVDLTQAPLAMRSPQGDGQEGAEIDIVNEIARRWGMTVEYQAAPGGTVPGELGGDGPDLAVGGLPLSATDSPVTMVPVLRGGVAWAVRHGNPEHLSPISLCGRSVAVESGSLIRAKVLLPYEQTCQDQGNPMRVQTYGGQDQVTAALVAGKVDVIVGPGPAVDFAVAAASDRLELLAPEDREQRLGIAARPDDDSFASALQATVASMAQDGTLRRILDRWKLGDRDLAGSATATASEVPATESVATRTP